MNAIHLLTRFGLTKPPSGGGGGGVTFVAASATPGSGSTQFPIPVPAGAGAGSLLIAVVALAARANSLTLDSGWTLVLDALAPSPYAARVVIARRTLTGSEGAIVNLTTTIVNTSWVTSGAAYSGTNATPITATGSADWSLFAATGTAPSVTGDNGGMLVSGAVLSRANPPTLVADAGMNERISTYSGQVNLLVADESLAADGATGTRTHSASGTNNGAGVLYSVTIAPA